MVASEGSERRNAQANMSVASFVAAHRWFEDIYKPSCELHPCLVRFVSRYCLVFQQTLVIFYASDDMSTAGLSAINRISTLAMVQNDTNATL